MERAESELGVIRGTVDGIHSLFKECTKGQEVMLGTVFASAVYVTGLSGYAYYKIQNPDKPIEPQTELITFSEDMMKIEKHCPNNKGITIKTGALYGRDSKRLPYLDAIVFCNPK